MSGPSAATPLRRAAQELRAAIVRAAFADALAEFPDVRFALVPPTDDCPSDFFATAAFTFPESGIESPRESPESPVLIEINTYTPRMQLPAFALGMAAVADALRLCPTVTGADGYHALARISRPGDSEPYETGEPYDPFDAPGVAITYDLGVDGHTTLFLTLKRIAASDRAALADLIIRSAPQVAEPGFATPEKRLPTDEERAKFGYLMCLAPAKPTGRGTKRALSL